MPEIYEFNGKDITLAVLIQKRAVINILQKQYEISFIEALKRFNSSHTCGILEETENGLWAESAGYIADRYFEEIGNLN